MTAGLIFSIPSLCAFSCFISFMFNYYVRNANKTQLTSKTRATHRCSRHLQDLSRRFDEDPIQVLSSHNRPMPNINMRCSFISTSTLFCWNPSRKSLLILNKPHFWPWKNIYSANQFSHKSTRDAHQTLGFSLILAAQKIQRFQVASKNLPCRFGSFSRMWKLKKKMLATKPSPTLFHEAQCYCWKKKHFQTPSRRFEFQKFTSFCEIFGVKRKIRLPLAAGLPGIQQTCQLGLLEHDVSKVDCLQELTSWEFFCFHCKIIRRESKFDPKSCRTWSWSLQTFGISLYMNESEPKPTGFHVVQAAKCPGFR